MSQALQGSSTVRDQRMGEEQKIRQRVQFILQSFHRTTPSVCDRRRNHRVPFPHPIYVTPVDAEGNQALDETFVVLGKHLSEHGLDFYCQMPIPHRRVIASWEFGPGRWLALLMDLSWCRSNHHGWYENGGRFLQAVESPLGNEQPMGDTQGSSAGDGP